jgi:hypothetical protein
VDERVVVGTSGWTQFAGEWYPPGLPATERLTWYAERFDGVEVELHLLCAACAAHGRRMGTRDAAPLHIRRQAPPAAVAPRDAAVVAAEGPPQPDRARGQRARGA